MTMYLLQIISLLGGLGLFIDWTFLTDICSAWNVAVIHTCFNVATTCVLMPLNSLLVKLAYLIIPSEGTPQKAGELHESAAFAERFARYKAQYSFPEEG